jgi:hypothetical protein
MLKLVVVAQNPGEERALVRLAELAREVEPDAEVVVVPGAGRDLESRLDRALWERPLADRFVVVGRLGHCRPRDLRFLCEVLLDERGLAAVTTGADLGPSIDDVVIFGGAFRTGPLCQAGGFTGDGRRSLHDRLESIGFRTAVLPEPAGDSAGLRSVPA